MVEIYRPDPNAVLSNIGVATKAVPRQRVFVEPFEQSKDYGFTDAFGAAFLRENTVISATEYLTEQFREGPREKTDHNPYRYLKDSYDPATLDALAPFINDGEFEGSPNERVTKAIVDDLMYELELQKKMGGSVLGSLAGSLVTGLVDPTTYIPFVGQFYRGGKIARAGLVAFNAALSAGVSEAVLQATQRTRSLEETIMNIGSAGVLGGGLGIFASGLSKASALNPRNPNNPFRRENLNRQGEVYRTQDGKQDVIDADELDELQTTVGGSLGAARVGDDLTPADTTIARRDPKTMLGRAVRTIDRVFNSQTITGRIVRASSDTAREIGLRLSDPGAIVLKAHLRGKAQTHSAEILKKHYELDTQTLFANHGQRTNKVNQELGKSNWVPFNGKVKHEDMMLLTQRRLFDMVDDDLDQKFINDFGEEGFKIIDKAARENAEEVHKLNEVWEGRLIKQGLLQDTALTAKLQGDLDTLKAKVEQLDEAVKAHTGEGPSPKAELEEARKLRDVAREKLRAEKSKAVPLGRAYGHAQMWKSEAILTDPDGFKLFLLDALALKPDDDWLLTHHLMTADNLEALKVNDPATYRDILSDWAGDAFYHRIRKSEQALDAATENLKQAKLDLSESLIAANASRREEGQLTLREARARRNKVMSDLETARARKAELETQVKFLKDAALADRRPVAQRQGPVPTMKEAAEGEGLQARIDDYLSPDTAKKPRDRYKETLPKQGETFETARAEGRAEEAARQLGLEAKRLEVLEARAAELDRKLDEVERLREEETSMRQQLTEDVRLAKQERKLAAKTTAEAKRELLQGRKATPLDELVDDIFANITTNGRLPSGIMDRIAADSDRVTGRVKDRVISLDSDMRMEAIKRGWLNDDLSRVLWQQYDQLSAELAIREALGPSFNGSFQNAMKALDEEYAQLITEAGGAGTKMGAKLSKERRVLTDDMHELRDRLKGGFDDDGTTFGWIKWGAEKARQVNYIRFGGGFLLSSLTDTATVALRHGGLTKMLAKYGPETIRIMRQFQKEDPTAFNAMVYATEYAQGAAAAARRYGSDDLVHGGNMNHGLGYGRTRKVTGAIDRAGEKLSHAVATFSGLPAWNRFWKIAAGLSMSDKLGRMVSKYETLGQSEIADLASLGIGRSEAKRMSTYLAQFGKRDANGVFDPHLEKWGDSDDAAYAARDFQIAVIRDMERAINTPGIGDTPRLMSKWHGRTLLQFQTFAFTFLNRFAYPVVQRASLFKDRQAFQSLGILATSAAFVMMAKDLINGRDPMERLKEENLGSTLHEIVDRSGMLGWTSPYADSLIKLTSPITGYGATSRYARNGWAESLLGINGALFSDIAKAGIAGTSGDPQVVDKLLTLAPFSTQLRLLGHLVTDQ